MKKRMISFAAALILILSLLAGCGQREAPGDGSGSLGNDVEQATAEPEKTEEKALSEDDLIITRKDFSRKSEDGTLLAEIYYDLVQLPETTDAYRKINACLQEDYQAFLDSIENPDFQSYLDNAAKNQAENAGEDWWNYFNTYTAFVSTCEDGILSIGYAEEWFMGGVANQNAHGLSFDLDSGEPITLRSIEQTVPENADFTGYVKAHIFWTMLEESKVDPLTMDYFPDLQLEDLAFYLVDKQLVIYINTYQLASGAVGSFEVPTGLYVDQPQGEIGAVAGQTWYGLYPGDDGSYRLPIIKLEEDGTFSTWGAYYHSDAGFEIRGTYETEHAAKDTLCFHGTSPIDESYRTEGAYELIRIGDSIQLLQLGDDILYVDDPHFTVWTLRTEIPD